MKRSTLSACVRAGVLALSLLVLPLSTPPFAQTATPTPETGFGA